MLSSRFFRKAGQTALWSSLLVLYLLPIWLPRYLPLTDLPQHLSLVAVLRQLSLGHPFYTAVFVPHLFPAHNVLHLLSCYVLSWVTGIDVANRVFLTLVALLVPLSFRYLVVRPETNGAGRPVLSLALLGFFGIYTYNYFWGFVNFSLALAFMFFALGLTLRMFEPGAGVGPISPGPPGAASADLLPTPEADRRARSEVARRAALLMLLLTLTFLAHSLAYLFLLAACLFAGLLCRFRPGESLRMRGRFRVLLLATAPSFALFLAWLAHQIAIMPLREGPLFKDYHLQEILIRWPRFLSMVAPAREPVSEALVVLVVAVVVVLVLRLRAASRAVPAVSTPNRHKGSQGQRPWNPAGNFELRTSNFGLRTAGASGAAPRIPRVLLLVGLAALLVYFAVPGKVGEASLLNERFAIIGFTFLAAWAARLELAAVQILPAPRSARTATLPAVLRVVLLVLVLANLGNILARTLIFDRQMRPLRPMLAEIEPNRIVMGLPFQQSMKPDLFGYPVFMHAASYYQVERPGLLGFSFAYARFNSIGYRFPRLLPHIGEWCPWVEIFREKWATYDYFVCSGDSEAVLMAPGHGLKIRGHSGIWTLLENTPKRVAYQEAAEFVRRELRDGLIPPDLRPFRSIVLPTEIDQTYFSGLPGSTLPCVDLWSLSRELMGVESDFWERLPALVFWLQGDCRGYQPVFQEMNEFRDFDSLRLRFQLLFRSSNGLVGVYRLTARD